MHINIPWKFMNEKKNIRAWKIISKWKLGIECFWMRLSKNVREITITLLEWSSLKKWFPSLFSQNQFSPQETKKNVWINFLVYPSFWIKKIFFLNSEKKFHVLHFNIGLNDFQLIFSITDKILINLNSALLIWHRICRLYPLYRGETLHQRECPGYDTKLHLLVELQFRRFRVRGVLPLLSGPLWTNVVVSVKVPSTDQINLFKNYSYSTRPFAKKKKKI